jgi:hypothetical protein
MVLAFEYVLPLYPSFLIYSFPNQCVREGSMVQMKDVPPLADYFKDVEDPRIDRKKPYPLRKCL